MNTLAQIDQEIAELKARRDRLQSLWTLRDEVTFLLRKSAGDGVEMRMGIITEHVLGEFLVTREEFFSRNRTDRVALARQAAMYLARKLCSKAVSLSDIGRYFDRDHGTVLHAMTAIRSRIETDSEFAEALVGVEARLRERLPSGVTVGEPVPAHWYYEI